MCVIGPRLFPAAGSTNVNPDIHLALTFSSAPAIGASGLIRIYDADDQRLVDTLDLSILRSPTWKETAMDSGKRARVVAVGPHGARHGERFLPWTITRRDEKRRYESADLGT